MKFKKPKSYFKFFLIPVVIIAGGFFWYNSYEPAAPTYSSPTYATKTPVTNALPEDGLIEGTRPHPTAPPEQEAEPIALSSAVNDPDLAGDEKASFSLQVRDLVSPYQVLGLFVMPGEKVDLEAIFTRAGRQYNIEAEAGEIEKTDDGQWFWTAPERPGVYELQIKGPVDAIQVNAFVKTTFDNGAGSTLNGYKIGAYQTKPLRQNPRFVPPKGLIEVTEASADVQISPHFKLGDFACHQTGDPKYLLLDERLVLKLEMLLEEVQQAGIEATSFTIMSGYRTPWYNEQIGNTTKYSLHLYGGAADIFIDEDKDGRMDDINKDGRVDLADARMLYDIADKMDQMSWYQPFLGGLGLYGPRPHRGPFVHVDVRGYNARW